MKFIVRTFAVIGVLVVVFASSGSLGIWHFRLTYQDVPATCEPPHAQE